MKKILIVEDHVDSCVWIAAVLRQCGFMALEAADGAVAVRMARSEMPDLILLDLHLPAGGGEFVMESLQRQPELAGIPIIIMTGDTEADRTQLKLKGAREVFGKPMDVHAFLNSIRRILADPAEPGAPGTAPDASDAPESGNKRTGSMTGGTADLLPA